MKKKRKYKQKGRALRMAFVVKESINVFEGRGCAGGAWRSGRDDASHPRLTPCPLCFQPKVKGDDTTRDRNSVELMLIMTS